MSKTDFCVCGHTTETHTNRACTACACRKIFVIHNNEYQHKKRTFVPKPDAPEPERVPEPEPLDDLQAVTPKNLCRWCGELLTNTRRRYCSEKCSNDHYRNLHKHELNIRQRKNYRKKTAHKKRCPACDQVIYKKV